MKKQTITPEMIMDATISYVADYGLENASTKKIASAINISEGSIFNNFPNKTALLIQCLYYVDCQIDKALKTVSSRGISLKHYMKALWYSYFDFLVTHRDYNKFYIQFHQSSYYNEDTINGTDASCAIFLKIMRKNMQLLNLDPDFLWAYLTESTQHFALIVSDSPTPSSLDADKVFRLLAYGIMNK